MKKLLIIALFILSGCQQNTSSYSAAEQKLLDKYGVLDMAENDCDNPDTVKKMLSKDFKKANLKKYCGVKVNKADGVNEMVEANLKTKQIREYQSLSYFHADKINRYLKYPAKTIKDKVIRVNMNLDLKPYATTNTIKDDSDLTMLINKYNSLPDGYVPNDLVDVNYVCQQGEDFSCSTMDKMQLREEAAKAYEAFVEAGHKQELNIVAIATYRTYEYQKSLYNYNKQQSGVEYADQFYARPGQSEHNSGLAVDITFNGYDYNTIEEQEGYDWILNNMHEYGFILRYPEGKSELTQYGYESWHLRYVGKGLATKLYKDDITLDEYYGMK